MPIYQLNIQPQSYLLCSNAETSSTLDSQFVFDQNGFPYFPAKTFKGLLKESMIEVLEIEGKTETEIAVTINHFFGIEGDSYNNGLLNISNLYLKDYDDTDPYFSSKNKLSKYEIQSYYLSRIQQTALDENEIALDTSLRSYGVLNYERANCFTTQLNIKEISEIETLQCAISNLRYAGTRRNRGFGKIKCGLTLTNIPQSKNELKKAAWIENCSVLDITIQLKEPVVLGTQNTDTNTVFSQDYIAGSQVLGMLAWAFPDKKNTDFNELFLYDHLQFGACYPDGSVALPLSIQKEKYEPVATFHNLLSNKPNTVTKNIGGLINEEGEVKVKKHFNFHSSRIERSAGRSVKDQATGGIFYYESLDKGIIFNGKISGDTVILEKLYKQFGGTTQQQLGKSKSSQYGNIEVTLTPAENTTTTTISKECYYLVVQSPIILYNDYGYPSPTKEELQTAIGNNVKICDEATTSVVPIELYNSSWLAKSGKVMAFKEGSTFKVETNDAIPKEQTIGEWRTKGFGKVKFLSKIEMETYMEWLKKKPSENKDSFTPPSIIVAISNEIKDEETKIIQQSKAQLDARSLNKRLKDKQLSNSLIGRMLAMLNLKEKEIEQFMNNIKEKPAGKALSDAYLYDDLKKSAYADKDYWVAYFEYLRKANKAK